MSGLGKREGHLIALETAYLVALLDGVHDIIHCDLPQEIKDVAVLICVGLFFISVRREKSARAMSRLGNKELIVCSSQVLT